MLYQHVFISTQIEILSGQATAVQTPLAGQISEGTKPASKTRQSAARF